MEEIEPIHPKKEKKCCDQLKHATTGFIFYCFVVAYTMQTSVVVNYIEEDLKHHYGVNKCEAEEESESSKETSHEESDNNETDPYQQCEDEFKRWNFYLLVIYAVPAFILAPLVGNWSDSFHRVIPLYVAEVGIIISTLAIALAMQFGADPWIVTFCMYPTCLTGGVVVMTVIMFSYEAERREGFKIFERFLELTAFYVTATTSSQIILTLFDELIPAGLSRDLAYWIPLIFAGMALIRLALKKRNQVVDKREFEKSCVNILPVDFYRFFSFPLFIYIFLLFVCAFMYYLDYVGETLEVVNIVTEKESWQVSSFSVQGAVQGATQSLGLFVTLYLFKRVIHKHVVDKKMLPKIPLSYIGIVALFLDFLTKLIVSFVPPDVSKAQMWVPLIGVICELAIVVIRFFAVLLVPKCDAGKSLSLLAWAQLLAIVPGPMMIGSVSNWCQSFWSNFVYLFMGLLLIIPAVLLWVVGKFGPLPDLVQQAHPSEEEEKPRRGRRFKRRLKKSQNVDTELASVVSR